MSAMDSRQPSLLDATAATRPARSRPPSPLLPRRGAVEVVRHAGGSVEVKISGLLIMVVGAALAVVVVAVRWDIERSRTVRVLQADLQMAQARERCWEALARFTPRTTDDVIAPGKRDAWVARCLSTELTRVNAKR